MDYFQHNASKGQQPPKFEPPRKETRDPYQMHTHRYTGEQLKAAAFLAGRVTLA